MSGNKPAQENRKAHYDYVTTLNRRKQRMQTCQKQDLKKKTEDPRPIKKMSKLKSGHHKTEINKDLEKTTFNYAETVQIFYSIIIYM